MLFCRRDLEQQDRRRMVWRLNGGQRRRAEGSLSQLLPSAGIKHGRCRPRCAEEHGFFDAPTIAGRFPDGRLSAPIRRCHAESGEQLFYKASVGRMIEVIRPSMARYDRFRSGWRSSAARFREAPGV